MEICIIERRCLKLIKLVNPVTILLIGVCAIVVVRMLTVSTCLILKQLDILKSDSAKDKK